MQLLFILAQYYVPVFIIFDGGLLICEGASWPDGKKNAWKELTIQCTSVDKLIS